MCYIHQLYLYFELTRKFDLKKQSIRIKGPKSMHVLSQHIKISTRSQFCLAKKPPKQLTSTMTYLSIYTKEIVLLLIASYND